MSQVQVSSVQLNTVISTVNAIQSAQQQLGRSVDELAGNQELTRNEVAALRGILEEFIRADQLAKNLQLAQTSIIDVRAQLQTEFGHYNEVRRLATGLLQATDAGIVSTATMRALSEELMLTTPRYWLAPALVALAAWIRDDRALADKALREALRRDHSKTSLFFSLVLRRHRRNSATARWLGQYVSRQDPNSLPREFVVILDAVATGALGAESRPLVLDQVGEWFDSVNAVEEVREAQIKRWMDLLDGMRGRVDSRFKVLPEVSSTWPTLKELYEGATVHGRALDHFESLFEGEVTLSFDQRKRVDDILDSLVKNFDAEELPHRREEARLQAIIDHEGDKVTAAQAAAAESSTHEERVDVLTLLTNAAFFPEQAGASKGTQRMATAMAKDWISEADGRLHARNIARLPAQVDLKIEGWQSSISEQATEEGLTHSLAEKIEADTAQKVAAVRFTGGPMIAAILGGVLAVVALIVMATGGVGGGLFLLLLAAGAGGYSWYEASNLPKRREAARQEGEARKQRALAKLSGAIAEVGDLRGDWEGEIAKQAALHERVSRLDVSGFALNAADEQRRVG